VSAHGASAPLGLACERPAKLLSGEGEAARVESDESWRPKGSTGFGARLLIDLLMNFSKQPKS